MSAVRTPRHEVAPTAIPKALRALWNECCSGEQGSSVSRALTQNLLVLGDAARERELRQVLDALAARLPCRAFLALLTPGGRELSATVHGAAREHGSIRDLVLEQIELRVPQAAFAQLPGVVRPLLVNDIPTHCYWASPWPDDPRRFDALAKLAEHTIVDSARFALPATELDALEARRRAGTRITDLTWLRLRPWRRALAEVLERTGYRSEVATAVTIRHGDDALAPAALLGRWLERRLEAEVALEPAGEPGPGLRAVELHHGDATATATLVDDARVRTQIETAQACYLPFSVPASRGSEASLLAAAIDMA
ncbi:MAG: glucose-6-phosphate dehydrogenase assembly protein OpcA [Planctomycetota bacterium]